MPFMNRSEAGRSLAVALARYKEEEPAILALPRGGVAVAAEVAAALRCAARLDPRAQGRRAFPTGISHGCGC